MRVVVSNYAWVERSALTDAQLEALKTALTFTPASFGEEEEEKKPIRLYREAAGFFGMPREYFLARRREHHQVEFKLSDGAPLPTPIQFNPKYKLEPEQEKLRAHLLDLFEKGTLGGIVEASTGFGKTVLSTAVAESLQRPTLVIVHRGFLLKQWIRAIKKFLPGAQIGVVQQGQCDFQGKHIVIAMIQTLVKREFPEEFKRWPGLVIFDECHRGGARSWANVLGIFRARHRLCFSATPKRPDGAEVAVYYHGGPILYTYKKLRRPPKVKRVHTAFTLPDHLKDKDGAFLNLLHLHRLMAEDHERTNLAADIVARAIRAGWKVLVLAAWKVHLKKLEKAVFAQGWERGKRPKTFYVVGGVSEQTILQAEREGDLILGTWGYAKEALDIPNLTMLLVYTPTSQMEQAIGRIARDSDGKRDPLVVDLRDVQVIKCNQMGRKRDAQYLALLGPDWNK